MGETIMKTFTPGPWRVSGFEKTVPSRMVMGSDDFSVAFVDGRSQEENEANASAIAVLPEALERLREAESFIGSPINELFFDNLDGDPRREWLRSVRKILKASGIKPENLAGRWRT
jgi:hypothetical protein